MQDTERALLRAEHEWLVARGWVAARPPSDLLSRVRYTHHEPFNRSTAEVLSGGLLAVDAVRVTRLEPLRFVARRG